MFFFFPSDNWSLLPQTLKSSVAQVKPWEVQSRCFRQGNNAIFIQNDYNIPWLHGGGGWGSLFLLDFWKQQIESHPSNQRLWNPQHRASGLVGRRLCPQSHWTLCWPWGTDMACQGVRPLPVTLSQGQKEDEQKVPTSWPLWWDNRKMYPSIALRGSLRD